MTVTRLVHLSDFHLGPVPFPTERPPRLKPALGWINWRRAAGEHDADVLARTIESARAWNPDHWLVTGDLVELGETHEYRRAAGVLAGIAVPDRVTLTLGNHDVYTTDAAPRMAGPWAPWLGSDPAIAADPRSAFPRLVTVDRAHVIAVSTGIPTWTFSAEGALGRAQLARLNNLLAGLDRRQAMPVLAIHHPPADPRLTALTRLRDGADLVAILARHSVPLVVHGHVHEAGSRRLDHSGHSITFLGVSSASTTESDPVRRAAHNRITVSEGEGGFTFAVETVLTA